MFELWFYFFLEDGRLDPNLPPQRAYVCYPESIPAHVRSAVKLTEEDYYCPMVFFETKGDCEFAAPQLLGPAQFDGFYNGAEGPPVYGVAWKCRKGAGIS